MHGSNQCRLLLALALLYRFASLPPRLSPAFGGTTAGRQVGREIQQDKWVLEFGLPADFFRKAQ